MVEEAVAAGWRIQEWAKKEVMLVYILDMNLLINPCLKNIVMSGCESCDA